MHTVHACLSQSTACTQSMLVSPSQQRAHSPCLSLPVNSLHTVHACFSQSTTCTPSMLVSPSRAQHALISLRTLKIPRPPFDKRQPNRHYRGKHGHHVIVQWQNHANEARGYSKFRIKMKSSGWCLSWKQGMKKVCGQCQYKRCRTITFPHLPISTPQIPNMYVL